MSTHINIDMYLRRVAIFADGRTVVILPDGLEDAHGSAARIAAGLSKSLRSEGVELTPVVTLRSGDAQLARSAVLMELEAGDEMDPGGYREIGYRETLQSIVTTDERVPPEHMLLYESATAPSMRLDYDQALALEGALGTYADMMDGLAEDNEPTGAESEQALRLAKHISHTLHSS
jgi:hypothetical protein